MGVAFFQFHIPGEAPAGFLVLFRMDAEERAVITDNGNVILDIHQLSITDPVAMEQAINQIPGVVSAGLFACRPADVVIVGGEPPTVL